MFTWMLHSSKIDSQGGNSISKLQNNCAVLDTKGWSADYCTYHNHAIFLRISLEDCYL